MPASVGYFLVVGVRRKKMEYTKGTDGIYIPGIYFYSGGVLSHLIPLCVSLICCMYIPCIYYRFGVPFPFCARALIFLRFFPLNRVSRFLFSVPCTSVAFFDDFAVVHEYM